MGNVTVNRSYHYPTSDDDVRPHNDIEQLASDVDIDVQALYAAPVCHLTQQTAQTGWTTATATAITFGASSEVIDSDTLHDTGSNTSRIVIGKKLGWWEISGVYAPAGNTAQAQARAIIYKNGVAVEGSYAGLGANASGVFQGIATPTILVQATNVNDYVELMGFLQAASGTIGTTVNTYIRSSFTAVWKRAS